MAVLGIDVGGHSIKAGIVTAKGTILEKKETITETKKGRKTVVSNIIKVAELFLKKNKDIKSIGVGVPGIIDKKGYISYTPNIPLSRFDLGKELKKKIKKEIVFGNDADNFVLAEYNFGAGKGAKTVIGLTLGTGMGSGIIINGNLFSNKGAPELGHTTIKFDSPKAKCCGNDGCIESFIGRKAFSEEPIELYKKALAGNKKAIKTFAEYGKHLGIAISNFVNTFNPDLVILGGQLSNAYRFFSKPMEKEVEKRALFKTRIIRSRIKEAGMIGAASLTF